MSSIRGVSVTKAAAAVFGLFALMAISASTSARQQERYQTRLQQEKLAKMGEPCCHCQPPHPSCSSETANKQQAKEVEKEEVKTVKEQAKEEVAKEEVKQQAKEEQQVKASGATSKETVHIDVHIHNLPKHEAVVEQKKAADVKAVEDVKTEDVKTVQQGEVKEVAAKKEEVKAATTESKAAAAPLPETKVQAPVKAAVTPKAKVVKPVSMSVLVVPLLAVAAVLVAVKHRKPGYLPDVVEEKLESMGYPAQSSYSRPSDRPAAASWSSQTRSVYGAV